MRYEIRGRVIDAVSGDGIGGVRVEAWDKDFGLDDYLGVATTITDGSFVISFDETAFRDLFDQWPDLYFKVFCHDTLLASTEDSVVWNVKQPTVGVTIKAQHPAPGTVRRDRRARQVRSPAPQVPVSVAAPASDLPGHRAARSAAGSGCAETGARSGGAPRPRF